MLSILFFCLFLTSLYSHSVVDVFTAGDDPDNKQYRIPALVLTGKGTLIAFAEARTEPSTDCGYKWIVARRSIDNGLTWSTNIDVVGRLNTSWATGNPQAVYDSVTGKVVLVYGSKFLSGKPVYCSPGDAVFVVDDGGSDGLTWGTPMNITSFLGLNIIPGPGAALQTSISHPGRLIFSGSCSRDMVFFSDDHGATFTASTPFLDKMDESTLVELTNGTVVVNMRNDHATSCDCRAYATSNDGGLTFSPIQYDPVLIDPVCEAALTKHSNFRVYFANGASKTRRENLTVRRTKPNSLVWETSTYLVSPGVMFGGYNSMTQREVTPGFGGILWERFGNDNVTDVISFTLFPLDF